MEERTIRKIVRGLILVVGTLIATVATAQPARDPSAQSAQSDGAAMTIESNKAAKDVPARTVFLDINAVEGAAKYDVVVMAITQKWQEPYKFSMESTTLRMRLTPGQYMLKTRSVDAAGRAGFWGLWKKFWVGYRSPTDVFPANGAVITPKGSNSERLIFEWPAVPTAKAYEFRLHDAQGKTIKHVRSVNSWIPADLALDSSYSWSVTPLNSIKEPVATPANKGTFEFSVGVPTKELRGVVVDLPPIEKAERYRFEFVRFETETKTSEPTFYESREPTFRARLEPGDYEMRVRSEYADGNFSDWSVPHRFLIPIPRVDLVGPMKNEHIDPTDDLEAQVKLKWKKMKHARQYMLRVWDEDGALIATQYTEDTSAWVGVPHDKKYRWHVQALLAREKPRAPASAAEIPDEVGQFRVDHYTRLNLSAAEEPSHLYAWGRYIGSIMDYQSANFDDNTKLTEKVFGGTGELAVGYWHRKSNVGLLVPAALSGFSIRNMTYNYSHASILMGYRKMSDGPSRWRVWAGPAFHQAPEIMVDGLTQKLHFSRVESYGPEFRATYMRELWGKYGLQVYFSYYMGLTGHKTPNGHAFKEAALTNFGFFGTMRLRADAIGMLGYSYQSEGAKYQSGDAFTNGVNNFTFTGHFLSATLQVGLEKSQR